MKKILACILAVLLIGCSDIYPRMPYSIAQTELDFDRGEFCRFAREAIGLPVLLNGELRKEAYAVLGQTKATSLFRPVARANNAFRCLCGTPEERLIAKC